MSSVAVTRIHGRTSLTQAVIDRVRSQGRVEFSRDAAGVAPELSVSRFGRHVSSQLAKDVDAARALQPPHFAPRDRRFGGFGSTELMDQHLFDRVSTALDGRLSTRQYVIPSGATFLGPPYDNEWQTGGGLAFGARVDGKVFTISSEGFSGAGVSFFVSSPEHLLAAITPQGRYRFSWLSVEAHPFLRSAGGIGVVVYLNANPVPVWQHRATLWNVSGVNAWSGDSGEGNIADAASPVSGMSFGPVPIAPVFVNTAPGQNYEVWFYCWQTESRGSDPDSGFIAFMQFEMPFVTINAGPPPIIH